MIPLLVNKPRRSGSPRRLYAALWLGVLISAPSLVLLFAGGDWQMALRYERVAVLQDGQWWRLLSGQWSHLGWQHGVLNLLGWWLIWMFFVPTIGIGRGLVLLAGGVAGTALGLLASPQVQWYAGLSGALHGVLGGAALLWWNRQRWLSVALLALLFAKLAGERLFGPLGTAGLPEGARVVTEAHLWGAGVGLVAGFCVFAYDSRRRYV